MTVLVGYLPTPEGEAAFAAGLAEAQRRREPMTVVNSPRGGAPVSVDVAGEDATRQLLVRAREAGVEVAVRQQPHDGDAADELLRLADEADASVVVIGTRRRSAVGKLLMGSTAQRVLLQSVRPVLVVKP